MCNKIFEPFEWLFIIHKMLSLLSLEMFLMIYEIILYIINHIPLNKHPLSKDFKNSLPSLTLKTVLTLISWLLLKSADQDPHCFSFI